MCRSSNSRSSRRKFDAATLIQKTHSAISPFENPGEPARAADLTLNDARRSHFDLNLADRRGANSVTNNLDLAAAHH